MEQFLEKNQNPVISVENDGMVLYSNEAGEPLLHEWGVEIGGKLPSTIRDLVQRVISRNNPENIEVKVGNRVYLVVFHPLSGQKSVNISGFDITDQKELEEKLRIKEKQNDILYKIGKVSLEYESLQNFLDKSVKLIAGTLEVECCKILELMPDGNFLLRAGFGWKHGLVGKAIVGGEKESQAGYTLLSRMPVVVEDFAEESRFKKPEILKMHEVDSGVSVTIGSTGKIFGVLGVHSKKKRKFTSDDTYFLSSVAFLIAQVVERKKAEEALKKAHDSLEETVKERTAELQKAYDSLKQSEKSLAEAQRMTHIGNWDWNLVTGEVYWSDETYRIFRLKPQELKVNYNTFLSYVHPDDRDRIDNAVNEALKGKPFEVDYRIIRANGEERTAHEKAEVIFDDSKNPIRFIGTVQDITEHWKTAEKILNLANIVESSTEAIITKSFEGIITSWNKGAEKDYGYSVEEVLGKSISILEPPTLTGETLRLCKVVQQGEKIQQYETLRLRKDGKLINISLTIFPVYDNQGKITAASIISTDITRRKEAEEKLRVSEEKYRNIVETANELILTTDNENVITYVNKRIVDMLGYTTEELIGRPIWGFISEECSPIVKKNLKKRRQGISGSYELKLIRKDGSSVWTFLNAKPLFDKEGKYVGAMSMLTDITERKKAEEALAEFEITRQKEIHHRIKNNLQVISSLLDLQADKFDNPKVIEAFRESQDRVISMALIHEELYKGNQTNTLNFSTYIEELAENLFQTYSLKSKNIHLDMDLEEKAFFDMDTAIPLGIIVNELVSNSLKHAFQGRDKGEIRIKLHREDGECKREGSKSTGYTLNVSDNGVGIPEGLNLEDTDSLGLQLVTALVDQLDGQLELKRNSGAEFAIRFTVKEDK
jgi:PAS domain S-box-containing protein